MMSSGALHLLTSRPANFRDAATAHRFEETKTTARLGPPQDINFQQTRLIAPALLAQLGVIYNNLQALQESVRNSNFDLQCHDTCIARSREYTRSRGLIIPGSFYAPLLTDPNTVSYFRVPDHCYVKLVSALGSCQKRKQA